jgi:acetyltransferase-like isoleucine patch superfamily enzyme
MWHRRFLIIVLSFTALLLLVPTGVALAAPVYDDQVVVGDDLTLREGERVNGDALVIGGDLTLRTDSLVTGNATVLGGNATIDGEIEGDLVAFGGRVTLGNEARVGGDVVALGGRVQRAEGAEVGNVVQGTGLGDLELGPIFRPPGIPRLIGARPESAILSTLGTLMGAVILSLIGMAVYTLWPTQTSEVGRTIVNAPLPSLGIGCLIYPLAAFFSLIILITICLAIFVPVVVLLVVAASLFGWIALGVLLGRWLASVTRWRSATPLALSGLGVFMLTILAAIVGEVPCLGSLLVLGAASIGLGAVTLSRFGTRRYGATGDITPPPAPLAPMPPPAPSALSTIPEDALDIAIREAIAEEPDEESDAAGETPEEGQPSEDREPSEEPESSEEAEPPESTKPPDKA